MGACRRARLGSCAALWLIAAGCGAGCGGASTKTTLLCEPPCPEGTQCTASGCVASAPNDLAVEVGGDLAGGCEPPCSGSAPRCNASRQCVPCLVDAHCPAGEICVTAGAASACVPGCHDDERCAGAGGSDGGAAMLRCCDGRCLDTSEDGANCGRCGAPCTTPHAAAACVAGACALAACDPGWGDCNGDASDGCETNLLVDARSCGACGAGCAIPHAVSGCAGGCYIVACEFGFDDCNADPHDGCETSVLSDVRSCGACGRACTKPPHAASVCTNASCALSRCDVGYSDCDGDPANGCETSVLSDAANCGGCRVACTQGLVCRNGGCTCAQCNFANASSKCVNNVCVMDRCVPGWADCNGMTNDGCEVDTTSDAGSCGACGVACPKDLPVCQMGVCGNCLMTLSNIGGSDFTIAFTVKSQANQSSTILGQRPVCDRGMMWDVRMGGGRLGFEADDTVNYASVTTVGTVNDGNPHSVVAHRSAGTMTVTIDNKQDSVVNAPAKFGVLPALYIAKGGPCEGRDGTVALVGTVTNVCLSSP